MGLKEQLAQDLKQAMKEKNQTKLGTVRLVMAELHKEEIAKKRALKEEEIQVLIQREIKKRKEAVASYQKGAREDLAQKEQQEEEVLKEYLPAPFSEAELETIIKKAIQESQAESIKDLGQVMSKVMPQVQGKADGKQVSEQVRKLLSPENK